MAIATPLAVLYASDEPSALELAVSVGRTDKLKTAIAALKNGGGGNVASVHKGSLMPRRPARRVDHDYTVNAMTVAVGCTVLLFGSVCLFYFIILLAFIFT